MRVILVLVALLETLQLVQDIRYALSVLVTILFCSFEQLIIVELATYSVLIVLRHHSWSRLVTPLLHEN